MERHDFDSTTPNFWMFTKGKVGYCLKEATIESVAISSDFRLGSCTVEMNQEEETIVPKSIGKMNESQLMLLERNIYLCDPASPDDPDKAIKLIDPAVIRGWSFAIGKKLGDKLEEMSGLKAKEKGKDDKGDPLGNS